MTAAPHQARSNQLWTSEYCLDHCEGYRVETSDGHLGFVEEVVWDPELGEPTELLIRKSHDAFGLVVVPTERVSNVRPEAEEILVALHAVSEPAPRRP